MLERIEFHRAGAFLDVLMAVKVIENFLGCAEGLLENIVNAGEAFDGLV